MMGVDFSTDEKKELLSIARNSIQSYLEHNKIKYPEITNPKFLKKMGVFVTLHADNSLRGCIGYPLPEKPLVEAIVDNAISSSTQDPRFEPVALPEMKSIDIEISVLTVPQEVEGVDDVEIGRDGIIISKGFNRGLLLPQVPTEQNWTLDQYISYGCMKAGLPGDEWKRGIKIETFQAIVFGESGAPWDHI
jgi:AmmeMemoRadiSam system protein A